MKNFGFGLLCSLVFVVMYGVLRDLSIGVQNSTSISLVTSGIFAISSLYTLKVISHPRSIKNEFVKSLFNGAFHSLNVVWLSNAFTDIAKISIAGNNYAEGQFGDKTHVDWLFVNLSGLLISLVVFHLIFRFISSFNHDEASD